MAAVEPYAAPEDVAAWTGQDAPAAATRLILRATELIDSVITAAYDTDDDTGLPTDADLLQDLNDAVCAQVEAWAETGEANDIDGLAGAQISVGNYSGPRAPRLAPRARAALIRHGLLGQPAA